ncbi:hypothetical protein CCH79_00010526 [Gambusia affinis]|uniref:Uncharacterized protein n=1 Tax=Gambusia affinis TaxID=33528 RepID=A0A315V0Q1_GAMAF|nr:hypothetical protein CCH79_00010526 [Gambusia affinis]
MRKPNNNSSDDEFTFTSEKDNRSKACETLRSVRLGTTNRKQTGPPADKHTNDTLIGLRHQLDEVKAINVEMYQKMQSSDEEMKKKNNVISRLEEKTNQITATMKQLEQSDKDLLSQTRTLAMSFVKCASTDTEHQYKLVKDISF